MLLKILYVVGIPLVVLGLSGCSKKLARGTRFRWPDFFVGIDAALTAVTTGLAGLSDLFKANARAVSVCLTLAFVAYVAVLIIHQDRERGATNPDGTATREGVFWLGYVANGIGIGALILVLGLIVRT